MIIYNEFKHGKNQITSIDGKGKEMGMDISVYMANPDEIISLQDNNKETAILLLDGKVEFFWENNKEIAVRRSVYDEKPIVLHVAKGVSVKIYSKSKAEFLVQKTTNEKIFPSKLYKQDQITQQIFGENQWEDTARGIVRTVFDYNNAPYSNMVLGEVINFPGRWSSYIPHGHDQPEVYFYKFDKTQGFGAGFIGDEVFKIKHNSALCIKGGPTHPQTSAPGYVMYYCWMIRHFDGNPWTSRDNAKEHEWLLEKNPQIWQGKEQ